MSLLVRSTVQLGVVVVLTNLVVLATEQLDLGLTGWRIAVVLTLALGVFVLRLYPEVALAAFRSSRESAETGD